MVQWLKWRAFKLGCMWPLNSNESDTPVIEDPHFVVKNITY